MQKLGIKSRFNSSWLSRVLKTSIGFCALFLVLQSIGQADAQSSELPSIPLPDLVKQLGSDDFQLRLSAENQLLEIGAPAIELLKQARLEGDCEVRLRSRRLLTRVLRKDHEQRLEKFLKSTTAEDFGLTGWNEFSSISGIDAAARRLFVAMYGAEKELFQTWKAGPADLERVGETVLKKLPKISGAKILPTLACALLIKTREQQTATADPQAAKTVRENDILIDITNHQSSIANSLDGDGARVAHVIMASGEYPAYRKLIVAWLNSMPDSTLSKTIKMRVANRYKLLEFVDEVAAALNESEVAVEVRAEAIAFVAQTRNPKFLDAMESLLGEETVLGTFQTGISQDHKLEVRVSDIALAGAVFIAEQPFAKFGFEHYRGLSDEFITISQAGFSVDEKRQLALKKWDEFKKQTPSSREGK